MHPPGCLFWAECFVAAESSSAFTQQAKSKFMSCNDVLSRLCWECSSCRSVNGLNLLCKEAQHLAGDTGGSQVTPAVWTRWTDDCDRKKCITRTTSAVESHSSHILQKQQPSGKDRGKSALLQQRGYAKRLDVSLFHEWCDWLSVRLFLVLHDSYLASHCQGPQRAGLDSVKAYLPVIGTGWTKPWALGQRLPFSPRVILKVTGVPQ